MRVARLYSIDDIRVEEEAIPEVGIGEALVRTQVCGICTGDIMGWYMERKAPLVFGHEPTGEIVSLGEGGDDLALAPTIGDRVFVHHHAPCGTCRQCQRGQHVHCKTWRNTGLRPGGMSEYFIVSRENLAADTLRLPDDVDYEAGSLIEPVACVVKSLGRANVREGDVVAVIGVGVMGQLHVALAAAAGARVIAIDRVPFRLERAREIGADAAVNIDEIDLHSAISDLTDGAMADVVIVGPGSVEAMRTGVDIAGAGSRVVLFTTGTPNAELALSPFKLYFDEISLIPSYSCGPDDTRKALELIRDGIVPTDKLITHRFPLDQIDRAMEAAADVDKALKTVIVFD